MPPKMFTCALCGHEVSKRKSLAFSDGRACRDHEEVQEMIRRAEEQAKIEKIDKEKIDKEMNENLMVFMYSEQIRVLHTINGLPLSFLYDRIRQFMERSNIDLKVLDLIKEEVEERGAKISVKEIQESMMSWMVMQRHLHKPEESPE